MKKLLLTSVATIDKTFTFTEILNDEEGNEKFSGTREVTLAEGQNLDTELRKLCDNDIEIFIDGQTIGMGVLNKGAGMAAGEIEAKAEEGVQNVLPVEKVEEVVENTTDEVKVEVAE